MLYMLHVEYEMAHVQIKKSAKRLTLRLIYIKINIWPWFYQSQQFLHSYCVGEQFTDVCLFGMLAVSDQSNSVSHNPRTPAAAAVELLIWLGGLPHYLGLIAPGT